MCTRFTDGMARAKWFLKRFLKALPEGSLANHSAGLVCNQGMDSSFWVSFNTHNINVKKDPIILEV